MRFQPRGDGGFEIVQRQVDFRPVPVVFHHSAGMGDRGPIALKAAADLGQGQSAGNMGQIHRDLAGKCHGSALPCGRPEFRDIDPMCAGDDMLDKHAVSHGAACTPCAPAPGRADQWKFCVSCGFGGAKTVTCGLSVKRHPNVSHAAC